MSIIFDLIWYRKIYFKYPLFNARQLIQNDLSPFCNKVEQVGNCFLFFFVFDGKKKLENKLHLTSVTDVTHPLLVDKHIKMKAVSHIFVTQPCEWTIVVVQHCLVLSVCLVCKYQNGQGGCLTWHVSSIRGLIDCDAWYVTLSHSSYITFVKWLLHRNFTNTSFFNLEFKFLRILSFKRNSVLNVEKGFFCGF